MNTNIAANADAVSFDSAIAGIVAINRDNVALDARKGEKTLLAAQIAFALFSRENSSDAVAIGARGASAETLATFDATGGDIEGFRRDFNAEMRRQIRASYDAATVKTYDDAAKGELTRAASEHTKTEPARYPAKAPKGEKGKKGTEPVYCVMTDELAAMVRELNAAKKLASQVLDIVQAAAICNPAAVGYLNGTESLAFALANIRDEKEVATEGTDGAGDGSEGEEGEPDEAKFGHLLSTAFAYGAKLGLDKADMLKIAADHLRLRVTQG